MTKYVIYTVCHIFCDIFIFQYLYLYLPNIILFLKAYYVTAKYNLEFIFSCTFLIVIFYFISDFVIGSTHRVRGFRQ